MIKENTVLVCVNSDNAYNLYPGENYTVNKVRGDRVSLKECTPSAYYSLERFDVKNSNVTPMTKTETTSDTDFNIENVMRYCNENPGDTIYDMMDYFGFEEEEKTVWVKND